MDLCSAGCSSLVCLTVRRAEARISKRAVDQFIIPAQLEREHCEVEEVEARLTTSLPHQFTLELQEEVYLPKDLIQTGYLDLLAHHVRGS